MSMRPIDATNSSTARASVTSTVSRSQPKTVAPRASSAFAIAVPIPCAVPVTIATRPEKPPAGSAADIPPTLDQLANLIDTCLPHTQHVFIGPLVQPAE